MAYSSVVFWSLPLISFQFSILFQFSVFVSYYSACYAHGFTSCFILVHVVPIVEAIYPLTRAGPEFFSALGKTTYSAPKLEKRERCNKARRASKQNWAGKNNK